MIRFTYRPDLDATVFEVLENFSVTEYREAVESFMTADEFRPGMPAIWDLRSVLAHEVTTADIQAVAAHNEKISDARGSNWQVALVVSTDLAYGLGRMFEAYSSTVPNRVMIFRSMEEAEAWVSQPGSG